MMNTQPSSAPGIGAIWKDNTGKTWKFSETGWVEDNSNAVVTQDNGSFDVKQDDQGIATALKAGGAQDTDIQNALKQRQQILASKQNEVVADPAVDAIKTDSNDPFGGKTKTEVLREAFNSGVTDNAELSKISKTFDLLSQGGDGLYGSPVTTSTTTDPSKTTTSTTSTSVTPDQLKFQQMIKSASTVEEAKSINDYFKSAYGYGVFEEKPKTTSAEEEKRQMALKNVDILEKTYGRGDGSAVGTANDLSLANGGNLLDRASATIEGATAPLLDPKLKQDLDVYKGALTNIVGSFTQAFGSGTPQEAEAKRFMDNAPGLGTSDQVAKEWFNNVRQFLGGEAKDYSNNKDNQDNNPGGVRGLIKNAGTDTKEIINGVLNIPSAIVQNYEEVLAKHPNAQPTPAELVGNFAKNFGLGMVSEYNDLLGEPLKGGDVLNRIATRMYEKPITTVLDILPIKKLLSVGKAGKIAKGAEVAGEVSKTAKAVEVAGDVTKDSKFLKQASRTYRTQFTVPTKIAKNINLVKNAEELVKDGITGTLDEQKAIAEAVTGKNGLGTKLVKQVISEAKTPVDIGEAQTSVRALVEKSGEIVDKKGLIKSINNILSEGQTDIGKIDPTTAIDKIRELESQGHNLQNAGYNPYNPNIALQQKGAVYIAGADSLKSQLSGVSVSSASIQALKTPENISAFKKISPRLAEEFSKAKTLDDLRKLQARYVTLSQAIDITENASQSPFVQLAKSLGTRLGGGVTGGAFGGIPGAVIGTIAGPTIEGVIESRLPQIQSKISQFINKAGMRSVPKK